MQISCFLIYRIVVREVLRECHLHYKSIVFETNFVSNFYFRSLILLIKHKRNVITSLQCVSSLVGSKDSTHVVLVLRASRCYYTSLNKIVSNNRWTYEIMHLTPNKVVRDRQQQATTLKTSDRSGPYSQLNLKLTIGYTTVVDAVGVCLTVSFTTSGNIK